jgi:plasmid stabilization system protein ParE
MSVKVIPTIAARLDLDRIFTYFVEQQRPDLAAQFNDAFEETLGFIADFPELGIPLDSEKKRLANVRIKPVHGFGKYLAYYRVSADGVYVLRVFHGHQDIETLL